MRLKYPFGYLRPKLQIHILNVKNNNLKILQIFKEL